MTSQQTCSPSNEVLRLYLLTKCIKKKKKKKTTGTKGKKSTICCQKSTSFIWSRFLHRPVNGRGGDGGEDARTQQVTRH